MANACHTLIQIIIAIPVTKIEFSLSMWRNWGSEEASMTSHNWKMVETEFDLKFASFQNQYSQAFYDGLFPRTLRHLGSIFS